MINPPKWAQDLVINACIKMDSELPTLTWRQRNSEASNGYCDLPSRHIVIHAGKNHLDQKLYLLHELAHAITGHQHTSEFWDMAWKLYRWAKLPIKHCQKREYPYKKGAAIAYRRSKKN